MVISSSSIFGKSASRSENNLSDTVFEKFWSSETSPSRFVDPDPDPDPDENSIADPAFPACLFLLSF